MKNRFATLFKRDLVYMSMIYATIACSGFSFQSCSTMSTTTTTAMNTESPPQASDAMGDLARLETQRDLAHTNQHDVLCPLTYRKAEDAYQQVIKHQVEYQEVATVEHKIRQSEDGFQKCNALLERVKPTLDEIVKARFNAKQARADLYAKKELVDADEKLIAKASQMEKSDYVSIPKGIDEIKYLYLNAELKALNKTTLDPYRKQISQAIQDGAKKLAPRTLAEASSKLNRIDSLIAVDRYNTDNIRDELKSLDQTLVNLSQLINGSLPDDKHPRQLAADDQLEIERIQSFDNDQVLLGWMSYFQMMVVN